MNTSSSLQDTQAQQTSSSVPAIAGPCASSSADLYHHIARTLRVSVRHLPWAVARQIHAQHETIETRGTFIDPAGNLPLVELEDFCWRADVTVTHIARARSLGWHELARLLILAKACECEGLELGPEHSVLPATLQCEVFEWP